LGDVTEVLEERNRGADALRRLERVVGEEDRGRSRGEREFGEYQGGGFPSFILLWKGKEEEWERGGGTPLEEPLPEIVK